MIKLTKVEKQYSDGNMCLKDINLRIDNGEFVFLLGHSGAGKSTLLKLISREEKVTNGKIIVNKENITNIKDRKIHNYRRNLGIIFQDYKLLQEKTVYENVELALRVVGSNPKNIKQKVMDVLEKVGISHKYNK